MKYGDIGVGICLKSMLILGRASDSCNDTRIIKNREKEASQDYLTTLPVAYHRLHSWEFIGNTYIVTAAKCIGFFNELGRHKKCLTPIHRASMRWVTTPDISGRFPKNSQMGLNITLLCDCLPPPFPSSVHPSAAPPLLPYQIRSSEALAIVP